MMYNTTRTDPNIDAEVNLLVGKPFGLWHKIKNGRIGSEPFIIQQASPSFAINLDCNSYERKCNMELRPSGIIVHFKKKYTSFMWPIPFHHLTIYSAASVISIYQHTDFLKLAPHIPTKNSSPFLQKLLKSKTLHSQQYTFQ